LSKTIQLKAKAKAEQQHLRRTPQLSFNSMICFRKTVAPLKQFLSAVTMHRKVQEQLKQGSIWGWVMQQRVLLTVSRSCGEHEIHHYVSYRFKESQQSLDFQK